MSSHKKFSKFSMIKNNDDLFDGPQGPQWEPSTERIKKMLSKYNLSEIAREEGVSRSSVCAFVKRNGLEEYREQVGHHLNSKFFSWKGHEKITGTYWGRLTRQAKNRKVKFDMTIEEGWEMYLAQDGKCAISGLPIHFGVQKGQKGGPKCPTRGGVYRGKYFERQIQTASLDRVDSSLKIYDTDNCQWVHANVNLMKNKMSDEKVIKWAKRIYLYNLSKGKYNLKK